MKKLALLTLLAFGGNSAMANTENNDIPSLWQLTASKTANELRSQGTSSAHVVVNHNAVNSLRAERAYKLPISADITLSIVLVNKRLRGNTQVWSIKNQADTTLPDGKLFERDGSISAWIPTEQGTFRLVEDILVQEYRSHGHKIDYRVVPLPQSSMESFNNEHDALAEDSNSHKHSHSHSHTQNRKLVEINTKAQQINVIDDADAENDIDEETDFVVSPKVLFVMTEEFAAAFDEPEDLIEEAVIVNNEIYEESGVNIQLEVADFVQVDLEPFTNEQILDNLSRSQSDGSTYGEIASELLEAVWEAKLDSEADIVTVLTLSRLDGLCGEAWINGTAEEFFSSRFAVNVVSARAEFESGNTVTCATDTLGHEIGHNMGLGHSERQGEEGSVFHFGRGYGEVDNFTTIMAYPQEFGSAVGVPLYSSPELECLDGIACGIEADEDDGADAVLAINTVRRSVATMHSDARSMFIYDALDEIDEQFVGCIEDTNTIYYSNEEVEVVNCPGANVETFEGLDLLPKLRQFVVNSSEDPSLEPFRELNHLLTLDLRLTAVEELTPLAHLKDKLINFRFLADNVSCQDVNVVESWGIDNLIVLRDCFELDSDEDDFDNDGISNLFDIDDDNDGIDDLTDFLPYDDDNEGDIDADGVRDEEDAFPYNPEEFEDTDLDLIGNEEDEDDDNDGYDDHEDCAPLDPYLNDDCDFEPDDDGEPGDGEEEPGDGEEPAEEPDPDCDEDCNELPLAFVPYDYDGDGIADVGVRRASNAFQFIRNSSDGELQRIELGRSVNDISVSGDFDGDGIADIGVRRPENQFWYIRLSSEDELLRVNFGKQEEDIPVPADYDGDGVTDIAVRRPSTQQWFIRSSEFEETFSYRFGLQENDIPVPADYDGDGLADIAVRRPSNRFWYVLKSSDDEVIRMNFGLQEEDIPVPADYDGDGITDFAVRRPSNQTWYIRQSSDEQIYGITFGRDSKDIPIVADYDGDGLADIAVRRPGNFFQYILRSSDGEIDRVEFGKNTADMPLAAPITYRMEAVIETVGKITGDDEAPEQVDGLKYIEKIPLSAEEAARENVYIP